MTQRLTDLQIAAAACRAGADIAAQHFRNTVAENKTPDADYDPVTPGDRGAERAVRDVLQDHCPDDAIFGEEFGRSHSANGREWIIDPIDGTRAFVSGVPTWGTLVGLTIAGSHAIGAACQPITGDMFVSDGTTSWLGDTVIKTRSVAKISELRIATTAMDLLDAPLQAPFMDLSRQVAITRYGLDWYHYALLAAGGFDAVIECGLQPYDIAALIPIIRGADGIITD
ncbi:MAG: inositol monophosphatase family protein, partial [Pseudomonadota bacterium]